MAGSGRILAVLGLLVAGAVGAGLWLALGEPTETADEADGRPADATAEDASTKPVQAAQKGGRRHSRIVGNCAVFGTVKRRQESAPAAGQALALSREGFDDWSAVADADGAFRLGDLPDGGPYELKVESPGCGTIRLPGLVLTAGEERDLGTLWLDVAVRVTVTVKAWGGPPLEGAKVEAFVAPDWSRGWDWQKAWAQLAATPVPVASAATGADGKAVFPELATGIWTFAATKEGYARAGRANFRVESGGKEPELTISLPAGHTLTGLVLDGDGKAIEGCQVQGSPTQNVWDWGSAPLRSRSVSDAEGRYRLDSLGAGDVSLQVAQSGGMPYQVALVRIPNVSTYDIRVRTGGTLVGTVTDSAGGKPIEGATVRASSWQGVQRMAQATTGADGKYVLGGLPDSPLNDISVTKDGWIQDRSDAGMWRQEQVNAGETLTRDLKMRRGATLTGVVSGPDGPLSGVRVTVYLGTSQGGISSQTAVTTDAAGKYTVGPLDKGRGMVQAAKEGYFQRDFPEQWWMAMQQGSIPEKYRAQIPESGEVKLDLRLERGARVEGRVESEEGAVAGATVTLWSQGGASVTAKSQDDGFFALEGAAPGTKVSVRASHEEFIPKKTETVQVLDGQPTTGVLLQMARQRVVRGTVTSVTGAKLVDAQVSAVFQQGRGGGEQQFDGVPMAPGLATFGGTPVAEDGTYELKVPWYQGAFKVRAGAQGHSPADSAEIQLVETRTEYEANLSLEVGYSIQGRVVAGGVGVAGADVSIAPSQPGARNQQQVYYPGMQQFAGVVVAVTGADGAFRVGHVANGAYSVSARAESFVQKTAPDVKVPPGDVTLEIEPALEISGRVLFADGRPAPGAIVMPQKESPGQGNQQVYYGWGQNQAVAGTDGAFRIRGLESGLYRLTAQAPWDGSVNFRMTRGEPVAAGTVDHRLVVEPGGTITGRVVDPAKKPVANVWVSANPQKQEPSGMWAGRNARTKDDGTFELGGLGEGPFTVFANPPQFGDETASLPAQVQNVAPGTKDLELVLEAGLSIEGVVRDAQGKPASGLSLNVQWKPDPQQPGRQPNMNWNNSNTMTDSEGRFRFRGLGPGKYSIQSGGWGGRGGAEALLVTGGDEIVAGRTDVVLVATSGEKIAGVVLDASGRPLANANVNAYTQNRVNRGARTDADGKFEVAGLPPGTVNVGVNLQGYAPQNLQNVETGNLVLRIVLEKGVSMTGRVLDSGGAPLKHVYVQLRHTDGKSMGGAQTDENGSFTAENLAEGTYEVTVYIQRKQDDGSLRNEPVKAGTVRTGEEVEIRVP